MIHVKWIVLTLLIVILRNGQCTIPDCAYEACERITCPENLVTSCCPEIDRFVEVNKQCIREGGSSTLSTCSEAKCITGAYGVLTNGQIDFTLVEQAIQRLERMDPSLNVVLSIARENCVNKNYTCFPADDPDCLPWRFLNCAFYSYRLGCTTTNTAGDCADIVDDVNTCKPYQDQYVQELNDNCFY